VSYFVVLGVIGLVVVGASLLVGDVLDGLLDAVDAGGGWLSAPAIGGFLAAFGFAAALAEPSLGTGAAAGVGTGAGIVVGAGVAALTRALLRMRTDPTPRTADLVGRVGEVLLPVGPARLGRVRVTHLGQQLQLSARADEAIPVGRQVVVVEVLSPTAVIVTPTGLDQGVLP